VISQLLFFVQLPVEFTQFSIVRIYFWAFVPLSSSFSGHRLTDVCIWCCERLRFLFLCLRSRTGDAPFGHRRESVWFLRQSHDIYNHIFFAFFLRLNHPHATSKLWLKQNSLINLVTVKYDINGDIFSRNPFFLFLGADIRVSKVPKTQSWYLFSLFESSSFNE